MIKYRGHNNYDVRAASDEAAFHNFGDSMTVQSQAEDADINVLMHRYGITGKMPENPRLPSYGDFTEITDFRGAVEAVRQAHESFMEIPATVRAFFQNDPQLLLEFASDPANLPKMRELGLAKEVVRDVANSGGQGGAAAAAQGGAQGAQGGPAVGGPAAGAGGAPAAGGGGAGGSGGAQPHVGGDARGR